MTETYRGGMKLPIDLDVKTRKALEAMDKAIQDGIPTYEVKSGIIGTVVNPGQPGTPFQHTVYKIGRAHV